MNRKRRHFVFGLVASLLVLSALACVFPAEVAIDNGLLTSAIGEGYASIDIAKAGCDCDTSVVSGNVKYSDGNGPDKVKFNGTVEHVLDPYCEIPPDTNLWATGPYNPGGGVFNIGAFGNLDPYFDPEKCAECNGDGQVCWRIWLEGGKFDGYENWACDLLNHDALVVVEHRPGSPCAE